MTRCTCATDEAAARAAVRAYGQRCAAAERERIAEAIEAAVREHADHMATYTLPALQPGFMDGWNHALRLLRRDAAFIADRAARIARTEPTP